jgi:asparagine synthase (glutamine-hydrolysing)
MCGICGKVYFDPQRTVTRAELERMSQTLEHRGPDGEGISTDGRGLAIGAWRLLICVQWQVNP